MVYCQMTRTLLFLVWLKLVTANDIAGANSYFLYTLSQSDRLAVLDAMQEADMKLLRVFITQVDAGTKDSSAVAVNDLETLAVGSYDDTILGQIDTLASEAHERGIVAVESVSVKRKDEVDRCDLHLDIKLIIAMHDREMPSRHITFFDDVNFTMYADIPSAAGAVTPTSQIPDSTIFYTNSNAVADFDNRLRHILNYESPNFGVPWHQLSDVIFSFEIENEAMGHMNQVAPNWWCDRANIIRSVLGTTGIQISTGGGTDLPTSTQSQFFTCANLQIIAIHDYNLDPSYVASHIDAAKPLALQSGKRLLYEEFGALGRTKQSQIQDVTDTLISTGVPWMYWEVTKPGSGASNYEVWTDEPSWTTLRSQSLAANAHVGEFSWPEIDGDASS